MPCRPMSPDRSTASPARTLAGTISSECSTRPMPAVLMKIPSPFPWSTTFVSPVTISAPAARAAARIESSTVRNDSIGKPSSRMKAALSHAGRAPDIARSFTVPLTASVPMSPPGKKAGRTT